MSKIVYLLGAGASCNCLPIVSQIKERIPKLIETFNHDKYGLNDQYPLIDGKKNLEVIEKFIDDLNWMNELNLNHYSIDTVAKKFHLNREEKKYKRLKSIISSYFLIEQRLNKIDNRYDYFFASILSERMELPKDIRILSWNYDNQLELAFSDFCYDKSVETARQLLKVHEKFYRGLFQEDNPFLFKINGSFGAYSTNGGFNSFLNSFHNPERDFIRDVLTKHYLNLFLNNYIPGLSYSWEKPSITYEWIEKLMKDCNVLVTIGYSFPFFNREIDKKIFSSGNLEKIYVQNPDAEEIIEKIKGMHLFPSKTLFVPNKSTSEFLIPFEF